MMKRFIAIMTAVAMILPLLGTPSALADSVTGPWTWTDLSAQLTERSNRPMWAVAYANGSWFYTDGQNLWNGGQVYRYDGSTQINITSDVRNAGLERVDDIVSDGQSVLFLQDVVRLDNQLKVLAYRNGSYLSITGTVRNALNSNEGVSSISGKNGTWYIVTTNARLFRWDGSSTNPSQIALPSGLVNAVDYSANGMVYSVNHGSAMNGGRVALAIVPVSNNQWLLAGDPTNGTVRFFRFDGSAWSEVTGTVLPNADYISKISSNGNQAIVSGYANGTKNRLTDGSSAYDVFGQGNLGNALIGWNGKSWTIVDMKNLSRLSGSFLSQSTENYGRTGDRILTLAGDTSGRMLVGGALSTVDRDDPTFPLTAKLVMVTEGVSAPSTGGNTTGGSFGGDRVYTSAFGPRALVQGDPSDFRVGNGKEFAYRVTATDTDGVDRVELYVNGALIKTCYSDTCEFRSTYFTNGASTRSVKFSLRATDRRGYITETVATPDYLTVDQNSTATAGGSNSGSGTDTASGISSWTWLEPNTTTLNNDRSAAYNVGAWDANGLKKIEIYVNGSVIRTCDFSNATGNQTCATTLYANNYSQGTNVFVNAKITDANNNTVWTTNSTLTRSGTSGTGSSTGSIWTSIDPNVTTLNANQSVNFTANAQDNDGLTRIELFVNGSIVRTCEFGQLTGTQSCATSIFGSNYSQGTNVSLNAKSTDRFGTTLWSNTTTLTRSNDGSNGGNTSNSTPSVWEWVEPNATNIATNQSILYGVGAWDQDGISSITISVNGVARTPCTFGNATGNQQCTFTLNGSNYAAGSNVFINAVARDAQGRETWTSGKTVRIDNTSTGGTPTPSSNGQVTMTTDHPNTYRKNELLGFTTTGSDADGIDRVEIYVNAVKVKTCTGTASCSVTVGPFNTRLLVTYGAVLFDKSGNSVTSGYKQTFLSQ